MRSLSLLLSLLLVLTVSGWSRSPSAIRKDALTVGIRLANTPFGKNSTDAGKGFEHDLAAEISKRLGAPRFRIVTVNSLGDGLDMLEKHKVDVMLATVKPDSQLLQRFLPTKPYYATSLAIATLAGGKNIYSLTDLNGQYVTYTPDTKASVLAEKFIPKAKPEVVPEIDGGIELLLKGDVAAVMHDRAVLDWMARKNKSIKILPNSLSDDAYVMLTDKQSGALVAEIDKALASMLEAPADGESPMAQLCAKYGLPMTLAEKRVAPLAKEKTSTSASSANAQLEARLDKALKIAEQLRQELEAMRKEIK